ncbi:Lnb N-terminal periplasmic domain-containing protein [Gemmobacter serpentinus]|uniref:Lnb N-terminal periplasmic domain-containing protein n=1 Tax=Gemmobacter serpentinus TaxID=2652247 RepID=UPI00124D5CE6|nr:DUF4105 domain-containing protein [Gemmobacter serpentinus]
MIFAAVCLIFGLWAVTALRVQRQRAGLAAFGLGLLASIALHLTTEWGWAALALLIATILIWYLRLRPRLDRAWAPDVAHIVTGDVAGSLVRLHNIRAFHWQDRDHAQEHWTSETFDLDQLTGADMVTSVWGNPKIAHLLVSFHFATDQRVVFSVEIRRERDEKFSSIGGFFRQFELALIAAREDDIIRLRSNHRHEDVRLYPLRLTPEQLRPIFLAYVDLGNRVAHVPTFYNTLTANCATVVWHLIRALKPDLPLHPAVLLPGLLPDWLYKLGVLDGTGSLADLREAARISEKAQALPEGADFSRAIRS